MKKIFKRMVSGLPTVNSLLSLAEKLIAVVRLSVLADALGGGADVLLCCRRVFFFFRNDADRLSTVTQYEMLKGGNLKM